MKVKLTPSLSLSKREMRTLYDLARNLNRYIKFESKIVGKLVTPLLERERLGVSLTFIFFAFLLLFNSCYSESQTTDKTFAYFNLRYLQPDNEIKVEAHFSKGLELETAIPIKLKQDVIFQGESMKGKEVSKGGTRYNIVQKGNFQNEYTFEFSTPGTKRIERKLTMNSLEELTIQEDFSKSKGVQISWKGKPLSKNETLVFLFNNEKNNFVSAEIDGPTNTSTINVTSEKLKKLPEGNGEIYLVRKESNTIEHPNVTILSETEFYSPVIRVTILP